MISLYLQLHKLCMSSNLELYVFYSITGSQTLGMFSVTDLSYYSIFLLYLGDKS